MTRREFLFYGSIATGSAIATAICRRLWSPPQSENSILKKLESIEKERTEQHQRAANLLFKVYEKYINVDTDSDFYNYAYGLIEASQFSSYKEDTYGVVFPWVIQNPLPTPGLPNEIGLAVNYPEEQKIGGNLYARAQSDQNVTTAYKPFIALYVGRDLKVLKNRDSYQNMQPLNEEDFAHIWPHVFRDPPPSYQIRYREYTKGNLEALSEHNIRNGEFITYSILSNGFVRVFVE